jgi:hypothetical protein
MFGLVTGFHAKEVKLVTERDGRVDAKRCGLA